jgi:hypothetical protein
MASDTCTASTAAASSGGNGSGSSDAASIAHVYKTLVEQQKQELVESDTYFLVNEQWLSAFKAYAKSFTAASPSDIPPQHPGPIDNDELIEQPTLTTAPSSSSSTSSPSTSTLTLTSTSIKATVIEQNGWVLLKDGLQEGLNYSVVDSTTWKLLLETYGITSPTTRVNMYAVIAHLLIACCHVLCSGSKEAPRFADM